MGPTFTDRAAMECMICKYRSVLLTRGSWTLRWSCDAELGSYPTLVDSPLHHAAIITSFKRPMLVLAYFNQHLRTRLGLYPSLPTHGTYVYGRQLCACNSTYVHVHSCILVPMWSVAKHMYMYIVCGTLSSYIADRTKHIV